MKQYINTVYAVSKNYGKKYPYFQKTDKNR